MLTAGWGHRGTTNPSHLAAHEADRGSHQVPDLGHRSHPYIISAGIMYHNRDLSSYERVLYAAPTCRPPRRPASTSGGCRRRRAGPGATGQRQKTSETSSWPAQTAAAGGEDSERSGYDRHRLDPAIHTLPGWLISATDSTAKPVSINKDQSWRREVGRPEGAGLDPTSPGREHGWGTKGQECGPLPPKAPPDVSRSPVL